MGVTEILCSFRLVLEGKIGKQTPESSRLQLLDMFSDSRFTFVENTFSDSPKVPRAQFLGNDGLLCFINICKFGSFKNLLQRLLASLTLDWKDLFCWYKRKKWFLWTMVLCSLGIACLICEESHPSQCGDLKNSWLDDKLPLPRL